MTDRIIPDTLFDHSNAAKRDIGLSAVDNRPRWLVWVMRLLITVLVFGIAIIGTTLAYGMATVNHSTVTDTRFCKVVVAEHTLTATRTYTYPYTEVFGYRFIETQSIKETTVLDVQGFPLMVIGYNAESLANMTLDTSDPVETHIDREGTWWSMAVGQGESGVYTLKPARFYTFITGGAVAVMEYKAFC